MYAYVNGEYVDEDAASISIFDRGLQFGDGVFDTTRTFRGVPFKLEAHLERLCRSLRYMELDGDALTEDIYGAVDKLVELNSADLESLGDAWINIIVTRGRAADMDFVAREAPQPTVIVMVKRINFGAFAHLYSRGVDLGVSLLTRHFAGAIDPRVKTISRLGYVRADLKMLRAGPGAGEWCLIFNDDGSISEAKGANLMTISSETLTRPPRLEALEGVSLDTTCDLACAAGLSVEERRVTVYDVLNADETLITASSFCLLPVRSLDGIALRRGPMANRLLEAWIELAGVDFVQQAEALATRGAVESTPSLSQVESPVAITE